MFSTHDPQVMERAHRLIRMRDGKIVSDEAQREGRLAWWQTKLPPESTKGYLRVDEPSSTVAIGQSVVLATAGRALAI